MEIKITIRAVIDAAWSVFYVYISIISDLKKITTPSISVYR